MSIENNDWKAQERRAGNKAAASLRGELRHSISKSFRNRTGSMLRSNVSARYKNDHLDRLVLTSPKHSFVMNFGYNEPNEKVGFSQRRPGFVKAHFRGGGSVTGKVIPGYTRKGGTVLAHKRSAEHDAVGHIAEAIESSQVLEVLANDLAESRAVEVVSKLGI